MTHTAAKMAVAIGQTVNVRVESFTIQMKVLDVKSAWIELSRIAIPSDSRHLVNCHA